MAGVEELSVCVVFFVFELITIETPKLFCVSLMGLSLIACETEQIKIGPMVTPIPRRRPTKLARESVTLDHLSRGRTILGVGLGALQYEEFEALGDEPDLIVRGAMLDEGLDLLVKLWSGEIVEHQGKYYHVKEAQFLPQPVQQPRLPVWVAATWPNKAPFRRAARWDGVIPGWDVMGGSKQSPQDVRDMLAYIKGYRTSDGPFDLAYGGKTTGTDLRADAEEVSAYHDAGATWWLEDLNPWRGTLEDMWLRIRRGPTSLHI
jgi:alkanesulfonate monooxygenase SsuD/methylene tetrahydromethanopterin reductase-like flavin-dependent oxidoreductase (luciferase family)